MLQPIILKGLNIHAECGILCESNVVVFKHKIESIAINSKHFPNDAKILEFPNNWHLVPGFIDIHTHGAVGCDFMDANLDSFKKISSYMPQEGVTGFLATTMTASQAEIENTLTITKNYYDQQQNFIKSCGAELLGIHLEGPFINPKKCCAQPKDYIIKPNLDLLKKWQLLSGNLLRIVTIAPEMDGALEMIRFLLEQNIIASFGHSDADYTEGSTGLSAGINHVTHCFNTTRGIDHHNSSAIVAFLNDESVTIELIADGIHIHPAVLKLALKLKGADNIILVSDAMKAKGLNDGDYDFVGQTVHVKTGEARLSNGALAGSLLSLDQALRNMVKFSGCSLTEALKMVSENPARKLNIFDRKGSIAVGKDADLVVLDDKFKVRGTMCRGTMLFPMRSSCL